ncbi:protein gp37 [Neorhizobium galegae]|uniref:phage Gp37/Gp68 family protein n=1 Tax=Neorhizobium galegae TaxID=399 RepID=UPI001AE61182|nr:phage Gp37/Gp68 family protein [Neorhizobium galegae]MBP2560812.1 protein gp37 [Neorhizobium galegae]
MADGSKIEWTDATWNPITGCKVVSPGCTDCYAMKLAGTRLKHIPSRKGLTIDTKAGPVWTGEVRFNEEWLLQPLTWKRPRMIFVVAHGDLFSENVPDEWIDKIFAVMALAPQHIFQVLTKRPDRMRAYLTRPAGDGKQDVRNHLAWEVTGQIMNAWHPNWKSEDINGPHRSRAIGAFSKWPLPNVWLGISAEDQPRAEERVPPLLDTPAALHWISAEPLLGLIELHKLRHGAGWMDAIAGYDDHNSRYGAVTRRRLGWIVAGGESGRRARSAHPQWVRSLRDQAASASIPFLFKQWGNWAPSSPDQAAGNLHSGWVALSGRRPAKAHELYPQAGAAFMERMDKGDAGRLLDGELHNQFPEIQRMSR